MLKEQKFIISWAGFNAPFKDQLLRSVISGLKSICILMNQNSGYHKVKIGYFRE